jgi:hypothetical protein
MGYDHGLRGICRSWRRGCDVKEATCIVCEGPTLHQEVYNGAHRFKADCISYLQTCVKHLTERAAFGDQCYQDRCEGAFVEQSVMQRAVRSAGGGGAM